MSTLNKSNPAWKSVLFFLLACGLAIAAPARDYSKWMSHYYEAPQPDQVVPAVYSLSQEGYFDTAEHRTSAIGFFAQVFAKNPDRVDGWMAEFRNLPTSDQRLMAAALWYSGLPTGGDRLRKMARTSSPEIRAEIEQLAAQKPVPLRDTPVLSESSLNLQWGAFLASGDSQHIVNVLAALGSREPGLSSRTRSALAHNAATHRRVYEICQTQLARQPEAVRDQLHAVLVEAKPQM